MITHARYQSRDPCVICEIEPRYDTIRHTIFTCTKKLTNSRLNQPRGTKKTTTRSTRTVHTSAKARVTSVTDPDPSSGSPPKFNRLFTGPLPAFPVNFMQIRSQVFA